MLVEGGGSPRCLGRPLCARRGHLPRRVRAALAHIESSRFRLQVADTPWAPGIFLYFRGCIAAARHLARLRIDGLVTSPAARLTTDLIGLHLDRAGFAPAGRRIRISGAYRYLLPFETSLAWSHVR